MLSDRERRWIIAGGAGAFCLLYLWLVLFPLMGYHQKMRRRIDRSWRAMERLQQEIGDFVQTGIPVRDLIRRVTQEPQKIKPKEQIRIFVRRILGKRGAAFFSFDFAPVWEGPQVALRRCRVKGRAAPDRVIKLIQRIDESYAPLHVGFWQLDHLQNGLGDLTMDIYYLEGAHP